MSNADNRKGHKSADHKPDPHAAAQDPEPGSKDRPGFDLGGSVTDKTAGTGLGVGKDAAEDAQGRRLPRGGEADQTGSERASPPSRKELS